jgi:hypothetical protein
MGGELLLVAVRVQPLAACFRKVPLVVQDQADTDVPTTRMCVLVHACLHPWTCLHMQSACTLIAWGMCTPAAHWPRACKSQTERKHKAEQAAAAAAAETASANESAVPQVDTFNGGSGPSIGGEGDAGGGVVTASTAAPAAPDHRLQPAASATPGGDCVLQIESRTPSKSTADFHAAWCSSGAGGGYGDGAAVSAAAARVPHTHQSAGFGPPQQRP